MFDIQNLSLEDLKKLSEAIARYARARLARAQAERRLNAARAALEAYRTAMEG